MIDEQRQLRLSAQDLKRLQLMRCIKALEPIRVSGANLKALEFVLRTIEGVLE